MCDRSTSSVGGDALGGGSITRERGCQYGGMEPRTSVDYLVYLSDQLSEFFQLFEVFMSLHVDQTGFGVGRGIMPAVSPADGADPAAVAEVARKLDRTAGTLMELASVTDVRIDVQGIGPVDPFVNWNTIRQPKPVLKPANVRSCIDQARWSSRGIAASC